MGVSIRHPRTSDRSSTETLMDFQFHCCYEKDTGSWIASNPEPLGLLTHFGHETLARLHKKGGRWYLLRNSRSSGGPLFSGCRKQ